MTVEVNGIRGLVVMAADRGRPCQDPVIADLPLRMRWVPVVAVTLMVRTPEGRSVWTTGGRTNGGVGRHDQTSVVVMQTIIAIIIGRGGGRGMAVDPIG